jgi:hypothetical protein
MYVDTDPAGPVSRPIPVDLGMSKPRLDDRWTDTAGDDWAVVDTQDGPRLALCNSTGYPPARAVNRSAEYVHGEYGPLTLRLRAGRPAPYKITMKAGGAP